MKSTALAKKSLSISFPDSISSHCFKMTPMTFNIFLCSSDKIVVGFFINLTLTYRRKRKKSSDGTVGGLFSFITINSRLQFIFYRLAGWFAYLKFCHNYISFFFFFLA